MTDNIQKGAPQCGLYLILPENWMEEIFLTQLKGLFRAINASPYEKNSHVIELREGKRPYNQEQIDIIRAMAELTKSQGVIFVVGNDVDLAKSVVADGVLLFDANDIPHARDVMGDDAIVGLRCGTSRRMAAAALESGADYVSFYDDAGGYIDPSIIQWWRLKTDNPCLVEGRTTANDCGFYVESGVDFIDASHYVFGHPDGVMQGIVNMADAINETLMGNKRKYH